MPNGGPDCCGNCAHNRAVQKMPHPQPDKPDQFWELSHCTLRDVNITNPFWTYCPNFIYGKNPETRNKSEKPNGWITSSGLFEGYVRIPWHGINEPILSASVICLICNQRTDNGINIKHESKLYGFCSNRHYVEWWVSIHKDNSFNPEHYKLPE